MHAAGLEEKVLKRAPAAVSSDDAHHTAARDCDENLKSKSAQHIKKRRYMPLQDIHHDVCVTSLTELAAVEEKCGACSAAAAASDVLQLAREEAPTRQLYSDCFSTCWSPEKRTLAPFPDLLNVSISINVCANLR